MLVHLMMDDFSSANTQSPDSFIPAWEANAESRCVWGFVYASCAFMCVTVLVVGFLSHQDPECKNMTQTLD